MPGEKFHEKISYEKKINSFPDTRRKFSWFIAKRVFWQELQNRTARDKNRICEKILLKKFKKSAIADNRRKFSALLALKFQQVCQNLYQVSSWTSYEKIDGWKKMIDVFSRSFADFWRVLQNLFAGLSKHALYLSTGTFRERLIFVEKFSLSMSGKNYLRTFLSKVSGMFATTAFKASRRSFRRKTFSKMVIYDICSTFFRLWTKVFLTPSGKTPAQ